MRSVLSDLGVDPAKAPAAAAIGGPFVPLKPPRSGASAFERQLYRINVARAEIDQYIHTLVAVPVRKPVDRRGRYEFAVRHAHGPVPGPARHPYRHRLARRNRRTGARHRHRQSEHRRRRRRLRQHGRDRPRQWPVHPLRPSLGNRRQGRPDRADRRDHRQDRLDRALDRPASALRDAHQRRSGRSAEIPARRHQARKL